MKIKLTPELAYLIGVWKARPSSKGIGVRATGALQEIFIMESLRLGLARPNEIQLRKEEVYFHHSAYRKFFQKIARDELVFFKWRNEHAARFLAGIFDARGGIMGRGIFIARANSEDALLLERLGFHNVFNKGKLLILRTRTFAEFIRAYVRREESKRMLIGL